MATNDGAPVPIREWFLRSLNSRGITIGVVCAVVCCLFNRTAEVRTLENVALDACFQIRGERPFREKVFIVSIDEEALKRIGKPFVQISPELATVVRHLNACGVRAIGIDLMIAESAGGMQELRPGEIGDADLMGRAVAETGNVVLGEWIMGQEEPLAPMFQWRGAFPSTWSDVGFVDLTADSDTCIRQQQLRAKVSDSIHPCFALATYGKAANLDSRWFFESTLHGEAGPIPVEQGRLRINYRGPPDTIPRIPFRQVLDAANGGQPLAPELAGSVVMIGADMKAQQDRHATPYSSQYSALTLIPASWFGHEPKPMSGVEVQANLLGTLLDQSYITTPLLLSTPLLLLITGVILGSLLVRVNLEHGALITLIHHFAWKGITFCAFYFFAWRVELAAMLILGPLVYGSVFALRWRWVRRMMGMFKSEAIARAMELKPGFLDLRGQEQVVTVLFADIRGFTTISEGREPRAVVKLLNDYFTAIVPEIERNGGVVNQYMGDGVMVLFGAPFPQHDHADRAVRAGLAVLERVHEMSEHWVELGIEDFRIGVGIHSGMAVTGTVGSPGRLDYSAIGDTVNSASRIESATKQLGVELLISQQTYDMISPERRTEFGLSQQRHEISVRGKDQHLIVYTLLSKD